MTTRILPVLVLALGSVALAAGCRGHDPAADDWASVVLLDGARNDALAQVAVETGVPTQVLYALAYQQSRFVDPGVLPAETMDEPVTITDDPELESAVDAPAIVVDETDAPEGLEDVAEEIDLDPAAEVYTLDDEVDAAEPEMDASNPVDPTSPDDVIGEEHPETDAATIFFLTPDQVSWAATTLGISEDDVREDFASSARAAAALLLADLALSHTDAALATHARWEEAMVRFVGLDPADDAGRLAQSDFHAILTAGFDEITDDGEELLMVPARGAVLPDLRTPETPDTTGTESPTDGQVTIEALASGYPSTEWIAASSANYTRGRGYRVRYVVIHDMEGTMSGAVGVFRNPATQASAHYLVRARDGHIVQMVHEQDSAWHAGNRTINHSSIGIEHEGFADRAHGGGYYTSTLYEASARLTCAIAQRYDIPVDRRHIFGHGNVASDGSTHLCTDAQANRGACGGAGHHHDPGRYWDWNLYMNLVARCVSGHPHEPSAGHAPSTMPRGSTREQSSITTGWSGQRAVIDANGDLRFFATDAAHRLVELVRRDGHWGSFYVIDRGVRGYPAAIVSGARVAVAAHDADGHVRISIWDGGTGGWQTRELAGASTDAMPSLFVNADGRFEVFIRAESDHGLVHIAEQHVGGDFGSWRELHGNLRTMPTVIADAEGRPHVFAIGDGDGHVWTRVRTAPNEWAAWTYLNVRGNAPVSPVRLGDGRLGVVTRTHSGGIAAQFQDAHGAWSQHPREVSNVFTSNVVAIVDALGRVNVFSRGSDSGVRRIVRASDGHWGATTRLGGHAVMGPAPILTPDGIHVFVAGTNRALYEAHQSHTARSGWTGWIRHGGKLTAEGTTSSGVYAGLTRDGSQIPHEGLANATLREVLGIGTEPYGSIVDFRGQSYVSGRVSWFGGPNDTGIAPTGRMAISGELARTDNSPLHPSGATLAAHPERYYYCAMRFSYSPNGTGWWRDARIVVTNARTGVQVVVRPADWGPNTFTHRIIDLSPQAIADLGMSTDDTAYVAFAAPGTPLGPVH